MYKQALIAGTVLAGIAVILGAFGAHSLKAVVEPGKLLVFETGVRYHFYHSIALLAGGLIYMQYPCRQIRLATIFFVTGIGLFSGSLYAITLLSINGGSIGPLGILTPIGGLFFILGWMMLLMAVLRAK